MFCIAAFIVLVIISIFSARYRRMAKKAWSCVARRVTFRPCDTNFKNELKSRLLAHVANKTPRLVRAADIGLEVVAFIIVALTIWSLAVVVKSGLNLYVYGTCNPSNSASCSLGAEACSIETVTPSFWTSIKEFKVPQWIGHEFSSFGDTLAAIPTRMQNWKAEDYLPARPTYLKPYQANKPTALEIVDPGCRFCKVLYGNITESKFADKYNLTYIAYPIKDPRTSSGYKFPHSQLIAEYLEALKSQPLAGAKTTADWQLLDKIYGQKDEKGMSYQDKINMFLNEKQTEDLLHSWLKEFGYSDEQIATIDQTAGSSAVKTTIDKNRKIVEDKVRTVKIPTVIFGGRRHDGVVQTEALH